MNQCLSVYVTLFGRLPVYVHWLCCPHADFCCTSLCY